MPKKPTTASKQKPSSQTLAALLRREKVAALPAIKGWSPAELQDFWWCLIGRVELSRGTEVPLHLQSALFETVAGWPTVEGLTMNRAMWFIWQSRPEIQAQYPLKSEAQFTLYLAWFYTDGLREHQLATHLTPEVQAYLNARASSAIWPYASPAMETPPVMLALICKVRTDLPEAFGVNTPLGRLKALFWFFTAGVKRVGLAPILNEEWLNWCKTPTVAGPYYFDIPRLAYLRWVTYPPLQAPYPLDTTASVQQLQQWYDNNQQTDEDWRWHLQNADQRKAAWLQQYSTQIEFAPPTKTFGVNLIGFAFGELGIGEDIRTAAKTCEAFGIPYSVVNISPGAAVRQADQTLAGKVGENSAPGANAPYPVNIFCLTGFDTARVYLQLGPLLFKQRHNIGWWPWELPVWPKAYTPLFELIDEVWAATEFNLNMYRKATAKPVYTVPLAVYLPPHKPRTRKFFSLPAKPFLFLFIFDANSYPKRKNPFAAIEAFKAAFKASDKSVGLVFKTMNGKPEDPQWQRFTSLCAADPRIHLIEKTLDKTDVHALIESCDAYLSLHRSEGFGRTLAEALVLNKPVIASNYSGNCDFLTEETGYPVQGQLTRLETGDYPFIETQDQAHWFDADTADAALAMQTVVAQHKQQPAVFAEKAQRAQALFEQAGQHMQQRLLAVATKIQSL